MIDTGHASGDALVQLHRSVRDEAAAEPAPVSTAAPTKETQIIAIYGKGGIGKSFTLANLSYMMAQQGKKVLLIGCDPKSDTTSLLFGGRATPTIIETSSRKKLAGEEVTISDKELALSASLVESYSADFDPDAFVDEYQKELRTLIDAKIEAGDTFDVAETFGEEAGAAGGEVIDLMEALRASVARSKAARSGDAEPDEEKAPAKKGGGKKKAG